MVVLMGQVAVSCLAVRCGSPPGAGLVLQGAFYFVSTQSAASGEGVAELCAWLFEHQPQQGGDERRAGLLSLLGRNQVAAPGEYTEVVVHYPDSGVFMLQATNQLFNAGIRSYQQAGPAVLVIDAGCDLA